MEMTIYSGRRWRKICPRSGRVEGWKRRGRFVSLCNGVLREVSGEEVLRRLKKGPHLHTRRYSEARSFKIPRCIPRPTQFNQKSTQDACIQTDTESILSSSMSKTAPTTKHCVSQTSNKDKENKPTNRRSRSVSTEVLCPLPAKKPRPQSETREELAKKKIIESSEDTQTESDAHTDEQKKKELIILEEDIETLRRFIELNDTDIDLYLFDTNDLYKQSIFFKLNPLVRVKRCQKISEMIKQEAMIDFAKQLGLRSVGDSDSEKEKRRKMRKRAAKSRIEVVDITMDSDESDEISTRGRGGKNKNYKDFSSTDDSEPEKKRNTPYRSSKNRTPIIDTTESESNEEKKRKRTLPRTEHKWLAAEEDLKTRKRKIFKKKKIFLITRVNNAKSERERIEQSKEKKSVESETSETEVIKTRQYGNEDKNTRQKIEREKRATEIASDTSETEKDNQSEGDKITTGKSGAQQLNANKNTEGNDSTDMEENEGKTRSSKGKKRIITQSPKKRMETKDDVSDSEEDRKSRRSEREKKTTRHNPSQSVARKRIIDTNDDTSDSEKEDRKTRNAKGEKRTIKQSQSQSDLKNREKETHNETSDSGEEDSQMPNSKGENRTEPNTNKKIHINLTMKESQKRSQEKQKNKPVKGDAFTKQAGNKGRLEERRNSDEENLQPKMLSKSVSLMRRPIFVPKRSSVPPGREYTSLEDQAIVSWLSTSTARERAVNGNRIWRELQLDYHKITGQKRTWHSLRNRYLRYILPALGSLALPLNQQQRLRANANLGSLKSRRSRPTPGVVVPAVRSAWSRRPRAPLDSTPPQRDISESPPRRRTLRSSIRTQSPPPSPKRSPKKPSSHNHSLKSSPTRSRKQSSPNRSLKSSPTRSRKLSSPIRSPSRSLKLISSSRSHTKSRKDISPTRSRNLSPPSPHSSGLVKDRSPVNSPTSSPSYSELTRRFALRQRSTPQASSQTAPSQQEGKRRLYNAAR